MSDAKRTPLYDEHVALDARIVDFAGYRMPLQYEGILKEHARVRSAVGLFDVSHMGEVRIKGPEALAVANRLVTNDLEKLRDGRAQYNTMCAEDGTIVDDLIVYRFSAEDIFICVNASNRHTDFAHMVAHAEGDAKITDESDDWVQIAVQGPSAPELLSRLLPDVYPGKRPFRFETFSWEGQPAFVATTGYTGEPGGEVYVASAGGPALWRRLMELGADLGVGPVGLGARDTLRLEMAYCLYGNDIDRTTNPLEAGLGWVTKLGKQGFVGKAALDAVAAAGPQRKLVGIEVHERGIPRHDYPVLHDGAPVGKVTSGTKSPSTGRSVGLAYVPTALSAPGTALHVDCRGRLKPATIVETPFYRKDS